MELLANIKNKISQEVHHFSGQSDTEINTDQIAIMWVRGLGGYTSEIEIPNDVYQLSWKATKEIGELQMLAEILYSILNYRLLEVIVRKMCSENSENDLVLSITKNEANNRQVEDEMKKYILTQFNIDQCSEIVSNVKVEITGHTVNEWDVVSYNLWEGHNEEDWQDFKDNIFLRHYEYNSYRQMDTFELASYIYRHDRQYKLTRETKHALIASCHEKNKINLLYKMYKSDLNVNMILSKPDNDFIKVDMDTSIYGLINHEVEYVISDYLQKRKSISFKVEDTLIVKTNLIHIITGISDKIKECGNLEQGMLLAEQILTDVKRVYKIDYHFVEVIRTFALILSKNMEDVIVYVDNEKDRKLEGSKYKRIKMEVKSNNIKVSDSIATILFMNNSSFYSWFATKHYLRSDAWFVFSSLLSGM